MVSVASPVMNGSEASSAQHHVGDKGGRSSVVEFQPSKLAVVGSNPIARSNVDTTETLFVTQLET